MLDAKAREGVLVRLRRIQGQVEGLQRMVREGRYCIDVINQVAAVEAALHRVGGVLLENHLETCVASAFDSDDADDRRGKIKELVRVYDTLRPK